MEGGGMELKGKVAVVTGGTKGIGRAIAEALLGQGARVVVGARTEGDVRRAAEEMGADARGVVCDVRRAEECARLLEMAVEEFGGVDVLVNNAGVGVFAPVAELTVEAWDRVVETNLSGLFYCSHAALPHLKQRGGGWIINIGSLAGKNAFPGGAAYNATKFGLIGFSEALMQEVRHDGIRVSYIMPGSVATPGFSEADWKIQPEDLGQIVLDLLATPERTLPSRIEVRPSRPPKK
jgi:3-oxoacyl-[acyl-carrier protein] reductase